MPASSRAAQVGSKPPLKTLTLSGPTALLSASSGSILGATPGSAITSNIAGLVVNSVSRTYTWSGVGTAGLVSNGLVEFLHTSKTPSANNPVTLV